MNEMADDLGLKRSHFAVAHGMHNDNNYSILNNNNKLSQNDEEEYKNNN